MFGRPLVVTFMYEARVDCSTFLPRAVSAMRAAAAEHQ
jgi:hypothetical protein